MSQWLKVFFAFIVFCCFAQVSHADFFDYRLALVRDLSSSFEKSLKLNPPPVPIDLELARQQHEKYISLLETLLPEVSRINGDPTHPDCNFIEDTAIIVGDIAVISRMGASERRGEEVPVAQALQMLQVKTISLESPATMDGGDILYTGKHLFVGLSRRTNADALKQLKEIFQGKTEVVGIPVMEGLHLKSMVTLFDRDTLIVADGFDGAEMRKQGYTLVAVPDPVASNVLRLGSFLIVQEGFPVSEKILQELCDQKHVSMLKLNMSELIKADGALTCGSLLLK